MKVLLDTHTFLWWNEANAQLSKKASAIIADPRNELLLSVVSAWEILIKYQSDKLHIPEPPSVYLPTRMAHYSIEALPITLAHVHSAESLPVHHRDPFDRLLIAQAVAENLQIVTIDSAFKHYPVKVIW